MNVPARTRQYIDELRFASKLIGSNLLNGHGKRALDVGCGSGKGLLALRRLGYKVYGFDINPGHIQAARKLGLKNVLQWDAENGIPFNENFDLITCFGVLEHLRRPEKALQKLLMTKCKNLVIDVPNRHTEFLRLIYLMISKSRRLPISFINGNGFVLKDTEHLNVKTPIEWYYTVRRLLEGKNLYNMKLRCFTNFIMFSFASRNFVIPLPLIGSSTLIIISRD